jgi:hypothetical protein
MPDQRADAANAPDAQSLDANAATAALDEAKAQAAEVSIADLTCWIDFDEHSHGVTNFIILMSIVGAVDGWRRSEARDLF